MEMCCPNCGQEFLVQPVNKKSKGKGTGKGMILAVAAPRGDQRSQGSRSRSRSPPVAPPAQPISEKAWKTILNAVTLKELHKEPIQTK